MISILDVNAPLKKVNKYKLTAKDPQVKERYHKQHKDNIKTHGKA